MNGINQRGIRVGSRVRDNEKDEIYVVNQIYGRFVFFSRLHEKYELFTLRKDLFFDSKCDIEGKEHKYVYELCEEDFE